MDIQSLQIVSTYDRELYNAYLIEPVVAIDIETDTNNQHWLSGDRGLTFNADIILLSLYSPNLPALVLQAKYGGSESYIAEVFDPNVGKYVESNVVWEEKKKTKDGVEERVYVPTSFNRYIWQFEDYDVNFIKKFFGTGNKTIIAHNLVFDCRNIYGHFNIPVPRNITFWDTLAMGYTKALWNPDRKKDLYTAVEPLLSEDDKLWYSDMKTKRNKLGDLIIKSTSSEYRSEYYIPPLVNGVLQDPQERQILIDANIDNVLRYSAFDSVAAYALYLEQIESPVYGADKSTFLLDKYDEVAQTDIAYTRWCVETAAKGIKLDVPYVKQVRNELIETYREKLEALGLTFLTSYLTRNEKWLRWYFFGLSEEKYQWVKEYPTLNLEIPSDPELLKQHPYLITKGGKPSFGKQSMAFYLKTKESEGNEGDFEDNDEEIEDGDGDDELHHADLIALKELKETEAVLHRTEEFLRHAERDGRIHSIIQSLTNTGRSSSSQPNLQNIKFHKYKNGVIVERGFNGYLIPDDGCMFVELDGANAENHLAAMMAADSVFERTCCAEDLHTAMMVVWGVTDRRDSKILTFGTSYGMGAEKLSWKIGCSIEHAKELIENKKRQLAKTTEAQQRTSDFANAYGFTLTWTGRRIRIRTTIDKRTNKRVYKAFTAWNGTVQGGVGDWCKRGILQVDEHCHNSRFKSYVALQIHDSLIVSVKIEEADTVLAEAIEILATIVPDEWANRTTPRFRMLVDYVPRSNCKKWGYVHGQEYPHAHLFNQYLNRWGWHEHTPEDFENGVDRVWINAFGWGENALEAELQGSVPKIAPTPPQVGYTAIPEPFDWKVFQDSLQEAEAWLRMLPIDINGRVEKFSFVEGIEVLREICHKGLNNDYLTILESFDKMVEVVVRYKEWRERNKNC